MGIRKVWATLVCGVVFVSSPVAAAAETVIEGKWTIIHRVYPDENRGLTRGLGSVAVALADVLDEAVGVKATIVTEERKPEGPGHRIFIGDTFAENAGLMPTDFKGHDWGMAEKDGDLYFFGRDRAGASPTYEGGCVIPSAIAAVQFMRREVGVLFLMPGKVGREVPRLEKLSVPSGFSRRGTVKVSFQTGRYFDYPYNIANGIYGAGGFFTYGGHTYPVACPRKKYRESHPEYFARNSKGENIWAPTDGCQAYCISNPEFRELVYKELIRRLDAGAEVCQLAQNDGRAGLCRCSECHNLYGTGDDWCEKLWLFHKGIAEDVLRDRPGKIVQIICYHDTAQPPKTFKEFPSNVMIEMCRYGEDDLAPWKDYVVPNGYTYYLYNWSWYPILGFTPKRSVEGIVSQVKRFHHYGLKGIYRCGYGEMFGMEGPAYWVFNHLVEYPEADVQAVLTTYYQGAFGPAADIMRRFYEDLEDPLSIVEKRNSTLAADLVEETIQRPKERDPIGLLALVYTPERISRMDAALGDAQRAKGLSDKQVRRLQLVRTEWNYVRNVGMIAWRYAKFRDHPTKTGCDGILDLLEERNAMVKRLFPDGKVRTVKDWPEIQLFGNPPLAHFKLNGRLAAPIKEPLMWDVAKMRKYRIVPNELMTPEERKQELKAAGVQLIRTFAPVKTDLVNGAAFKPYPDGTGFWLEQGTNMHVRAMARIGAKEGFLPGKTYRISWLCRWEHVNSNRPWHGFYFSADFDKYSKERPYAVQEPADILHYGTSKGWTRESVVLTVCDQPGFVSDFTFRFWGGQGGVAEVRDVAFSEVE